MHFNEQSKPAYVKIIRAKLKAQMGEHAYRIDSFSDDKIIEMNEKWCKQLVEKFCARCAKLIEEHPDRYGIL